MGMFSETVVENREFSVVQDQSRLFTTHSKLFTAFLDCPRQHARHMQRCEHMCVVCTGVYVCRSPQCVQAKVHIMAGWYVQVSKVYEEVSVCMYRNVLGLVCRAVRGMYSNTNAMCRYNLCIHGDSHHGVWTVLTCKA